MTFDNYLQHLGFAFSSPLVYIAIVGIILLEVLMPARKSQKLFSRGLAADSIWFLMEYANVFLVTIYVIFLEQLYTRNFGHFRIEQNNEIQSFLLFLWGVLLSDFLGWLHHLVRHKVKLFWVFHTVHHSQRELNVFTDQRVHIAEYFIARTITTIPMLALGFGAPIIIGFNLFHLWYTKFYHANIKTNLGLLRFILVTPQSHRIHHAQNPKYHDKNFGVLLCIWDRIFGTHCTDSDVYPQSGLKKEEFELSKKYGILGEYFHAQIFPIKIIVKWLKM